MKSELKFSDGVEFNLYAKLHKEQRADGWYLVGNGMLVAVKNEAEADELLERCSVGKN